jgi:hypothetical protein
VTSSLEQHEPRDAVRESAHVEDRRLVRETAGEPIEALVGALLRRRLAAPVEEPDERSAEMFVLEACLPGIRVEPGEQARKHRGGKRLPVVVRAHDPDLEGAAILST